jgi:parvulin-like peptidyl-prolyl isomerase
MKKQVKVFSVLAVAAAAFALAGCGGGGSSSNQSVPDDAVAEVGSQPVSKAQFAVLLQQARQSYKARKQTFPKAGTPQYKQLQDQALDYLVQRAEFEQKAKDLGITITDAKVDARLKQIKQQYFGGSEKKYKDQLKSQGLTDQQVRDDVRSQLLSQEIFNKVTANVKVDDKAVETYYNTNKSQYSQPASRDVRHILVNSKSLAQQLDRQLQGNKGATFAALAKKYSKDPGSAAQGGKLTVSKGQTVPEFDKVAFTLKTNEISDPVHTTYGWHIIQALSAVRPAKQTPLKDVKASIQAQLLQTKKNSAMNKWVAGVKKDFADHVSYQTGYAPLTTSTSSTTSTNN